MNQPPGYLQKALRELERRLENRPSQVLILNINSMYLDPENRSRPWFIGSLSKLEELGFITIAIGPRSELHLRLAASTTSSGRA